MLRRRIEKSIDGWLRGSGKALLVSGVRQSGKTFIIRECLRKSGRDYVEFNLINQPDVAAILEESVSVDEFVHKRLMEMFRMYLIIGGMPAAVEQYRATGDINAVMDERASVMEQYRQDFTQYEADDKKLILTRIYDMIPAEVNEKNKCFTIADIEKNLRYDRIQDSFVWLWKAGVAQELAAHGYALRYYNSKKAGELDFVVEHCANVLPIEVKNGKNYERHSALSNVMSAGNYGIREAIVFSNENVSVRENIVYLPIYMVMFLNENDVEFGDISPARYKM